VLVGRWLIFLGKWWGKMIEGRAESLVPRLNVIIDAERGRIELLRDANDEHALLLARGRLEAWYAMLYFLTQYTDSLERFSSRDQKN